MIEGRGEYVYRAKLKKVVDGDTLDFELDLGFHTTVSIRTRLLDVDAPEVRGSEKPMGLQVKSLVIGFFEKWKEDEIIVETRKTGKYGRWLARVWVGDYYLNDLIVSWSREARSVKFD